MIGSLPDAIRAEIAPDADGTTVVRVWGDIDMATAPVFRDTLDLALEQGVSIVVDMSGIDFIGSVGVAILEDVAHRAQRSRGGLVVRNPSRMARKLFALVTLDGGVPIEPEVERVRAPASHLFDTG
jgi:anti-sigma B factor antagonist